MPSNKIPPIHNPKVFSLALAIKIVTLEPQTKVLLKDDAEKVQLSALIPLLGISPEKPYEDRGDIATVRLWASGKAARYFSGAGRWGMMKVSRLNRPNRQIVAVRVLPSIV